MNHKDWQRANIAIGSIVIALGLFNEFFGKGERPTGRWSVIFGPIFDSFGAHGLNATQILIGLVFIFFAIFKKE